MNHRDDWHRKHWVAEKEGHLALVIGNCIRKFKLLEGTNG